jgi:hypothetical protein
MNHKKINWSDFGFEKELNSELDYYSTKNNSRSSNSSGK